MAKIHQAVSFQQYLEFFPEIELPIIFSEENASVFSLENPPLPAVGIEQYILPAEEEIDETTEFVPCARIPNTLEFHAVVYWRAALMDYQYILITYTKDGQAIIDRRAIAGTYSDGKVFIRSVATIDPDWTIYVVSGQSDLKTDGTFNAADSKAFNLELLPDGKIINEI